MARIIEIVSEVVNGIVKDMVDGYVFTQFQKGRVKNSDTKATDTELGSVFPILPVMADENPCEYEPCDAVSCRYVLYQHAGVYRDTVLASEQVFGLAEVHVLQDEELEAKGSKSHSRSWIRMTLRTPRTFTVGEKEYQEVIRVTNSVDGSQALKVQVFALSKGRLITFKEGTKFLHKHTQAIGNADMGNYLLSCDMSFQNHIAGRLKALVDKQWDRATAVQWCRDGATDRKEGNKTIKGFIPKKVAEMVEEKILYGTEEFSFMTVLEYVSDALNGKEDNKSFEDILGTIAEKLVQEMNQIAA